MADLTKWKLTVNEGRQVWSYNEHSNSEQSFSEKYFLGIDTPSDTKDIEGLSTNTTEESVIKAIKFYSKLQSEDGHWANDYGGPMFLLPGLVITCYITGVEIAQEKRYQMIRYLKNTQREDGGWGLHIESPSTMFGSALTYVTLRLLGMEANDTVLNDAREWIKSNGKFKLHVLLFFKYFH